MKIMKAYENINILKQDSIAVELLLLSPLKIESLMSNIGVENKITNKNLYRPQMALAGYTGLFNYKSVQIFGNTEIFYLQTLSKIKRNEAFRRVVEQKVPCIILTNGHKLEKPLLDIAKKNKVAVLSTPFDTTKATFLLSEFLDDQFAPQAVIHGSFVDVYGIGVLFTGRSGIGKSEIALDLVERGHRLVADDVVMLTKKRETILMGSGTSLVQHFMEIRGLGIIDVRQMFGIRSIRFQKRLEIIVELSDYNENEEYTRLGSDEEPINLLGVEINTVKLPIFPGKNITVIAEVIAIHYLLRTYGYNASKVLADKLQDEIQNKSAHKSPFAYKRNVTWFQADLE